MKSDLDRYLEAEDATRDLKPVIEFGRGRISLGEAPGYLSFTLTPNSGRSQGSACILMTREEFSTLVARLSDLDMPKSEEQHALEREAADSSPEGRE